MTESLLRHLSPDGLHANPAFSHVVLVDGPHRLIAVGGQNAVRPDGTIAGLGDVVAQTEQALANLRTALGAAGADFADVVKWTIHLVRRPEDPPDGVGRAFAAARAILGDLPRPPAITVLQVVGLAHPEFLVEIEAWAAVPAAAAPA